jgi:hypothetical protein
MSRLLPATVSVAAAALALGVGVGAGPLAQSSAEESAQREARLEVRVERLADQVDQLELSAEADRQAIDTLAESAVGSRLSGRSVVVVVTPDARRADVRRAEDALTGAGATVTGVLTLRPTYVDAASAASPLEDLVLRLVPPGVSFAEGASPIERVGTVLARSLVHKPDEQPGEEPDPDAAEVLAGLQELAALTFDGDPGVRAGLAVVVSAGPTDDPALVGLLSALHAASAGTVLTAPTRSAGAGEGFSTVGGLRSAAGTTALVLALAEQAGGGSGNYGTGPGASSVLPPVGSAD